MERKKLQEKRKQGKKKVKILLPCHVQITGQWHLDTHCLVSRMKSLSLSHTQGQSVCRRGHDTDNHRDKPSGNLALETMLSITMCGFNYITDYWAWRLWGVRKPPRLCGFQVYVLLTRRSTVTAEVWEPGFIFVSQVFWFISTCLLVNTFGIEIIKRF